MRKIVIYSVIFSIISCSEKVDIKKIDSVKGYWQISTVETKEGLEKDYPLNENYEYFDIANKVGIHKKVRWQPMGKFLVDDMQEKLVIEEKDGKVLMNFSSAFGKHSEEITKLTDSILVLKSTEGTEFEYKKVNINTLPNYGKKAE